MTMRRWQRLALLHARWLCKLTPVKRLVSFQLSGMGPATKWEGRQTSGMEIE